MSYRLPRSDFRLPHWLPAVLLAVPLLAAPLLAAAPKVDYLYPAGAARAAEVELSAGGSFDNWPPNIWCSSGQIKVEAAEKKGELKVTVAADAPPGIHWLRLWNAEGASSSRPFVVGSLAETMESETNDDPRAPQAVEVPIVVNGQFGKRGDVDTFAVKLEAGQTLIAAMHANTDLASPIDSVVQVCDANGFVLAQNHDGRGLDPLLRFPAPASATYLVRAFAFPSEPNSTIGFDGGNDCIYRLTLTTGGYLHHAMPLAAPRDEPVEVRLIGWNFDPLREQAGPAGGPLPAFAFSSAVASAVPLPVAAHRIQVADEQPAGEPLAIELPVDVSACLLTPGEVDSYRFTARKGDKFDFRVESRALGYPLDGVLQVVELATGEVAAEVDDANRRPDPAIAFTAKTEGEYELRVRDLTDRGGMRFVYRLIAEPAAAGFELSLANDSFVVAAGGKVEIPVTIERIHGHAEEIEITAVDLPAGVACEPVVSQGKGDSAKKVTLTITAGNDAAAGAIRIRGTSSADDRTSRYATFNAATFPLPLQQAWLSVKTP